MSTRPVDRQAVWSALGTVLDPELDEPITELDFVESCTVSAAGEVTVGLRLPTFFCAPTFSFLMVADAYDAVMAVPGVNSATVTLADHSASEEINGGVAAHAGGCNGGASGPAFRLSALDLVTGSGESLPRASGLLQHAGCDR